MFSDRLALQIADVAKASAIPEAGMLAVVETETAGQPFEADGRTPTFLFERHKFYAALKDREPAKLKSAVKAGLAHPDWRAKTQYKDQRTSQMRLDLLAHAKQIDEECALRACSWGLAQVMGSECLEVGFVTARSLVDFMTSNGVSGQLIVMVRLIKGRKLDVAIERKDWAYFALRYNGKGYRKNQYDTRLAAADKKWERKLPQLRAAGEPVDHPEQHLSREEIEQIQIRLRRLNYTEVGRPDGRWGDKTAAAIFAFQKHEGLPATGHLDEETRTALEQADERPVPEDRANATLDDLREQKSSTIQKADTTETIGWGKIATGGSVLGGTVLESTINNPGDAIDKANDAIDKAHQIKGLWGSVQDLLPTPIHSLLLIAAVIVLVGGIYVVLRARGIKAARLSDYQLGIHAGTMRA